jgi:hypothetical protein
LKFVDKICRSFLIISFIKKIHSVGLRTDKGRERHDDANGQIFAKHSCEWAKIDLHVEKTRLNFSLDVIHPNGRRGMFGGITTDISMCTQNVPAGERGNKMANSRYLEFIGGQLRLMIYHSEISPRTK